MSSRFSTTWLVFPALALTLLLSASPAGAVRLSDTKSSKPTQAGGSSMSGEDGDTNIRLIPAFNFGYNKLGKGYEGYSDLGNAGLDLYIQPFRAPNQPTKAKHNMLFRFSFDYFPLQVPKQNLGLKEDMYSANLAFVYQFHKLNLQTEQAWLPFFSLGIGRYLDMVKLNSAATGTVQRNRQYSGFNASVGMALPWFKNFPIRVVPEIRYHRVKVVDSIATNMTYQIGLAYWPKAKQ